VLACPQEAWSWTQLAKIVLLDILLAGDNAIMIALAVRVLPRREQRLGRLWGTGGAVALRIVFLAVATWLLALPGLQILGGLLLLWIAWKLLAQSAAPGDPAQVAENTQARSAASLRDAVRIIIVADASMSLDNVVAVSGAAEGHLALAAAGIALSIPMVIWGSTLLGRLMDRYPWIVWLGGGVLGHVAGVLLLEDHQTVAWFGAVENPRWHPLPWGLAVAGTVFGWWSSRRRRA
jgi:YjbE family integral membrane protein